MKYILILIIICLFVACGIHGPNDKPMPIPEDYKMWKNIELVAFCLPYPETQFTPDYERDLGKGTQVFVSKDQQSTLVFSGNPVSISFEELKKNYLKQIEQRVGGSNPKHLETTHSFSLLWEEKDRSFYVKKWYLPELKETITFRFETPKEQYEDYKEMIHIIASQLPLCL